MVGKVGGRKLVFLVDLNVWLMMEIVCGVVFNILQVLGGGVVQLLFGRWLDFYSGMGFVGIEVFSRGCEMVYFVEMDFWVIDEVLNFNLVVIGF